MRAIHRVLFAAAIVAGCTTVNLPVHEVDEAWAGAVLINGKTVGIGARRSAFELLQGMAETFRLARAGAGQNDALVVLDGMPVTGGMDVLRHISSHDVQSITTLMPIDAVTRFGGLGGRGAILVTTKAGRQSG